MSNQIESQLDFAIENNFNVLLSGKHGVGKTSLVIDAFNRHDIRFLYFSASTMDPFVDFVGVPKEMEDSDTGEKYLGFIRPKQIDDSVEALFFDEYNRSPKKVRNAVMELIQFKSINGRKFPNLKYVWTAINPDDDDDSTYDVEILDPAQRDRFHMQIDVPYDVSLPYFSSSYSDVGLYAAEWWKSLSDKQQRQCSPRRLETAVKAYSLPGGNARQILSTIFPDEINVTNFIEFLSAGSLKTQINRAVTEKNTELLESIVNGSETGTVVDTLCDIVDKNVSVYESIIDVATDETLVRIIDRFGDSTREYLLGNEKYKERLTALAKAEKDEALQAKIESLCISTSNKGTNKNTKDEQSIYDFFDLITSMKD